MHYTTYRVALHEPCRSTPRELTSTTQAGLLQQVRLRVNFLDVEFTKARLPAILNTCLFTLLTALDIITLLFAINTAAFVVWIVATIILTLVTIMYRKFSPIGQVSLTHVYYYWRCREIWRVELARRCAADERSAIDGWY